MKPPECINSAPLADNPQWSTQEKAHAEASRMAERIMENVGEIVPTFIVVGKPDEMPKSVFVFHCPWGSDHEKDGHLYCMASLMQSMHADRYSLMAEVFMANYSPEEFGGNEYEPPVIMPRDKADALDGVTVCTVEKGKEPLLTQYLVKFDASGPRMKRHLEELPKDKALDAIGGRMVSLLEGGGTEQ